MASGIYFQYLKDKNFLVSVYYFLPNQNDDTDTRKLTLTDLAPAFIFLLFGYVLSFIALIGEILLNRKNMKHAMKRKRKRKRKLLCDLSI